MMHRRHRPPVDSGRSPMLWQLGESRATPSLEAMPLSSWEESTISSNPSASDYSGPWAYDYGTQFDPL